MILPEVRIRYNGVNVRLVMPQFKTFDNIKIMEAGIEAIKARLQSNRSEEDGYNKPLKRSYARKKKRLGANPWRDLRLTGSMLDGLKVRYASNTKVLADYTGRLNRIKAGVENEYHSIKRLLQFSPNDQQAMTTGAAKIFGAAVPNTLVGHGRSSAGARRTSFSRAA